MLSANLTPNKLPLGLGGQYPPIASMKDSIAMNYYGANDGISDTHGFFYPTNYDGTTQSIINTNVSLIKGSVVNDDNIYTASEEKIKKFGRYQNKVKRLSSIMLTKLVPTMATPTIVPYQDNVYQVDDTLVFIDFTASGVRAVCGRVNGDSDLTYGSITTVEATTVAGNDYNRLKTCQISDTEIFVAYINASHVLKTAILTVNSGTLAVTSSSPHTVTTATLIANSVLRGCVKLETNKIFISFQYGVSSTGNTYHYITTVSAGTFTDGSIVSVSEPHSGTQPGIRAVMLYGSEIISYGTGNNYSATVFTWSGTTLTNVTSTTSLELPLWSSTTGNILIGTKMVFANDVQDIVSGTLYENVGLGTNKRTGYVGSYTKIFPLTSTTWELLPLTYGRTLTVDIAPGLPAVTADYVYTGTRVYTKNNVTIKVDGVTIIDGEDMLLAEYFPINTDINRDSEVTIINNEASSVTMEVTELLANVE